MFSVAKRRRNTEVSETLRNFSVEALKAQFFRNFFVLRAHGPTGGMQLAVVAQISYNFAV
jgi:hypothetical protein